MRLYPNGKNFQINPVARGRQVYDPRTGTWGYSDNACLVVLTHLMADPIRYGGWGMALSEFDIDSATATADKCDAAVSVKGGGTEPRSRLWANIDLTRERGDVLADLLLSSGLRLLPTTDGKTAILIDEDDPTPTVTLDDQVIKGITWKRGPEGVERPNRATGSFLSEDRDFDLGEIQMDSVTWSVAQDEIDRTGDRVSDFSLAFCPSVAQAGRLIRRLFARQRAPTGSISCNLGGLMAMGHADGLVSLDDLGDKPVLMMPARLEAGLAGVSIPYLETPDLPTWVPATHEPDPVAAIPKTISLDTPPVPAHDSSAWRLTGWRWSDGATDIPGAPGAELRSKWHQTSPVAGQVSADEMEIVTRAGSLAWTRAEWGDDSSTYGVLIPADQTKTYLIRARSAHADEVSGWAETVVVPPNGYDNTTPGAPSVSVDALDITVSTTSMSAVRVRVRHKPSGGSYSLLGNADIAPWAPFTFTALAWSEYEITLLNSAGTASAATIVTT